MLTKIRVFAASAVGIFLLSSASLAVDNTSSALGTNLWFFSDNQAIWPFVDFFKQSRPFSSDWGDSRPLAIRSDGYPSKLESDQIAQALLFWDAQATVPYGAYTLLWDGDGDVSIDYTSATVVSSGTRRLVVTINKGSDPRLRIKITRTNTANPVINIRFIAPGFESTYQTQVFHPLFLDKISPFRVLRFMDWMAANSNPQVNWTDRNMLNSQTYANDHGVCIERLVELCNRLNCDGWFCLPVRGSDDCFRQYATYIRDNLHSNLKAYFEFGNEVWNGSLQQGAGYVDSLGVSMGFSEGWDAQHHGWAKRMTDMLIVVEQVYAGHMDRCVRVAATQLGNTGVAEGILTFYNGAKHADVLAVAPYFGASGSGTVDQLITTIAGQATLVGNWVTGDLAIAKRENLRLVAYESGLDIWGLSDTLQRLVRFDPRMKAIYKTFLDGWKAGGGTLINQYTFCDPGWGLMRTMDDSISQAPMYAAALDWVAANPRWWTESREGSTGILLVSMRKLNFVQTKSPSIFRLDGRAVGRITGSSLRQNSFVLPAGIYLEGNDPRSIEQECVVR